LLGSPGLFPTPNNFPLPALACSLLPAPLTLLPISDHTPPLYWLPMWLTLPPSLCSYIAGCFWLVAQSASHLSCWFLTRGYFTLKMEAIRSSRTSVHTRSTLRHIPEDGVLHSHCCENLKSYNARYHSTTLNKFLSTSSKKTEITDWLKKNITVDPT
jgi:hypothetical protein